jgi:hypothetical protein
MSLLVALHALTSHCLSLTSDVCSEQVLFSSVVIVSDRLLYAVTVYVVHVMLV